MEVGSSAKNGRWAAIPAAFRDEMRRDLIEQVFETHGRRVVSENIFDVLLGDPLGPTVLGMEQAS